MFYRIVNNYLLLTINKIKNIIMSDELKKKGTSDGGNPANIKGTLNDDNGDKKNKDVNVDDKKNQDNDNQTKVEKELENLKKDIQGKDAKISELSKQIADEKKAREEKELAGKSAEEKAEAYEKKVKAYEKKEAFRNAFKDSQLNADEWEFIDSGNYVEIAKNIKTIIERENENYAKQKLAEFKASKLGEVNGDVPNPKHNKPEEDSYLKEAEEMKNRV